MDRCVSVYVVIRSTGEYSDRYETVLGYHLAEEDAQAFCLGAEREWKEAAALFPLPAYPGIWGHDDFETVYPNRVRSVHTEFGALAIGTPDYTQGSEVARPPAEVARRKAVREKYSSDHTEARAKRLAHVTLDPDGHEDATWYYEVAHRLPEPPK